MERVQVVAIVVAAGSGSRLGADEPKAFLTIGGRPIVAVAVRETVNCPSIDAVVVVAPPGDEPRMRRALADVAPEAVVVGGGATAGERCPVVVGRCVVAGARGVPARAPVGIAGALGTTGL